MEMKTVGTMGVVKLLGKGEIWCLYANREKTVDVWCDYANA